VLVLAFAAGNLGRDGYAFGIAFVTGVNGLPVEYALVESLYEDIVPQNRLAEKRIAILNVGKEEEEVSDVLMCLVVWAQM